VQANIAVTAAEHCLALAGTAYSQNRFEEALAKYNEAMLLGVDPVEHAYQRWTCLMMLGWFESAWQETDRTEQRRRARGESTNHLPLHLRRVWDGTPLTGKRVLVRCYHGLGDTIQFVRYTPLLRRVASTVILQPQESLMPLLDANGITEIAHHGNTSKHVGVDVEVELMELPYIFRTSVETIPANIPYLHVASSRVKSRRAELEDLGLRAGTLNVGVVWSSGDWNPERNVDLGDMRRLGQIEGLRLFSLQRGEAARALRDSKWMLDTEDACGTVVDTAATILNLDLIISVDTMVAHLAGALGKPVWLLLPFAADWRWMAARTDSPWYPTMRLFRQERRGDWKRVIERVTLKLLRLKGLGAGLDHTSCGSSGAFSQSP
jgi:hypothetical protein